MSWLHGFGAWLHEMLVNGDPTVLFVSLVLFSLGIPLGILLTKLFVKDRRALVARSIAVDFPALSETYTFLFAVAKYTVQRPKHRTKESRASTIIDSLERQGRWSKLTQLWEELPSYLLPVLSYSGICFAGFYTAMVVAVLNPTPEYHFDNYLIYGMRAAAERVPEASNSSSVDRISRQPSSPTATPESAAGAPPPAIAAGAAPLQASSPERYTNDQIERYGRGTVAVSVAAFVGAYLWTLIFLARRVTNFDLSPFSFIRATIQICLACFVCIFLRHLYDSFSQMIWGSGTSGSATPTTSSWLLALAFLIGFYTSARTKLSARAFRVSPLQDPQRRRGRTGSGDAPRHDRRDRQLYQLSSR